MKKIVFISLFVFIKLHGEILDVNNCLNEARINSKKLESAHSQILMAEAMKNQALSPLLPHIAIEGRYELKNKGQDYSIFTQFGSAFSSKTIGVTAQMLLFDFFSSWNKYRASQCEIEISQKNQEKLLSRLEEEVKIAYFKVLENESSVQVIEDSSTRLERQLKSVQGFFEQGTASIADLLAVKMRKIEEKKSLLHAKAETLQSKIVLNNLLGRDVFSPLQLAGISIGRDLPDTPEVLQSSVLKNQCDVKVLREQIKSLNYLLKSAREAYAPNFYAFGGYSYLEDAPPRRKTENNWVSGGIGMTFSLYDGGGNRSEVQKIRAQIAKAEADLKDLEMTILKEVNQHYLRCKEGLENISVDEEAIVLAEESFHSVSDRYVQGLESIDSLLAAERALIQAQMNKNKTIYLYHANYAHLEAAVSDR